jgi:hypothetical protein
MQFWVLEVIFVRVFVYYINIVCSTVPKYPPTLHLNDDDFHPDCTITEYQY